MAAEHPDTDGPTTFNVTCAADGSVIEDVPTAVIRMSPGLSADLDAAIAEGKDSMVLPSEFEDEDDGGSIPLTSDMFRAFVAFARTHLNEDGTEVDEDSLPHIPLPLREGEYANNGVSEADAVWVEGLGMGSELLRWMNLANALDIKWLRSLTVMPLSLAFRGKTPRELQELFEIPDEDCLTPEEVKNYSEEWEEWVEEKREEERHDTAAERRERIRERWRRATAGARTLAAFMHMGRAASAPPMLRAISSESVAAELRAQGSA